MKRLSLVVGAIAMFAGAAMAYQVTGPVLDVTDTKIVVDKNGEKHEIARDKNTKGDKNVKKGDRVTVQFTMTATEIENKTPAKKTAAKKVAVKKASKKPAAKKSATAVASLPSAKTSISPQAAWPFPTGSKP